MKKQTDRTKKARMAAFLKNIFVRDFLWKLFAIAFAGLLWFLAAGF